MGLPAPVERGDLRRALCFLDSGVQLRDCLLETPGDEGRGRRIQNDRLRDCRKGCNREQDCRGRQLSER